MSGSSGRRKNSSLVCVLCIPLMCVYPVIPTFAVAAAMIHPSGAEFVLSNSPTLLPNLKPDDPIHARTWPVFIALRSDVGSPTDHRWQEQNRQNQSEILMILAGEFVLRRRFTAVSALAGDISERGWNRLLLHPKVLRIDLDAGGHGGTLESSTVIETNEAGQIGVTGRSITVAVLDTGIDTDHADLANQIIGQHCFCQNSDGSGCCPDGSVEQDGEGSAEDGRGHGTNVSGIIGSDGTIAPVGIAPDAGILAVKILDDNGTYSSVSQIVAGLDWVLVYHPEVNVVNMSLGSYALFEGNCDEAYSWTISTEEIIGALYLNGTTVVVSAMNDGDSAKMASPACLSHSIAVGAVYDSNIGEFSASFCSDSETGADQIACFSNSGSMLDLLAPGAMITSTGLGGGLSTLAGTSQAAPHVSATIALLLEFRPTLTPDDVEWILETSGSMLRDARNGRTFPRVDVKAALDYVSTEICDDFFDNDGDGQLDCADPSCEDKIDGDGVHCEPRGESSCNDGVDNDGDRSVDCLDSDCNASSECAEDCSDGVDNNNNGRADCADPDCELRTDISGKTCQAVVEDPCQAPTGIEGCSEPVEEEVPASGWACGYIPTAYGFVAKAEDLRQHQGEMTPDITRRGRLIWLTSLGMLLGYSLTLRHQQLRQRRRLN